MLFHAQVAEGIFLISSDISGPDSDGRSLKPGRATANSYLVIGEDIFPAYAECGGPFQRKQAASLHEQIPDRAACLVPTGIQVLCNHNFGCDELCSAYQSTVRKVVARKNVHIYALMGTAVLRVELL